MTNVYRPLSSDGTRIFAVGQCTLYALSLSTGAILWQVPMSAQSNDCGLPGNYQGPPIVADGMVHATETGVRVIANATTGVVQQRFSSSGYWGHTGVVVGGVWIYLEGEELVAIDTSTADLLWRIPGDWRGARVSATGDLILVATSYNLLGYQPAHRRAGLGRRLDQCLHRHAGRPRQPHPHGQPGLGPRLRSAVTRSPVRR